MVKLLDTTLRDAQQSLIAARLRTDQILPILEDMDSVGLFAMEVWGGATFDVCMRFLDEDPWDRLKAIRTKVRNTKLSALFRGQNLLAYRHYPDDIVERFVKKSVENGIDIVRVFDALNDIRNLKTAVKAAKGAGAEVQCGIVYTISPVHTLEYYSRLGEELASLEPDYLCVKDMSGILTPYVAFQLVTALKRIGLPIDLHSHCTAGFAPMTYLKAVEAGADILDCAISSMSGATSQPPIESLYYALRENYPLELNLHALRRVADYFWEIRKGYERFDYAKKERPVDLGVIIHQIPGGMLSNLIYQLEQQRALHRLEDVLKEVPRVREDLGWPPLVTPTSQIIGAQAVLNVLVGRYRLIPKEVKDYIRGLYGRPPAPISKEVLELTKEEVITVRPADLLPPLWEKIRNEVPRDLVEKEEDYLSYALLPNVALEFMQRRKKRFNQKAKTI
jgi:pyruvate carboxylase subunit B